MLQLYTLSFFLSPSLLPLLCRIACQFTSYKPREVDPKLSLRVWFFLLCASNVPSFWSHARDGAIEARAVILDFVGMGYLPSKLHLILLDTFILCLHMVRTTISYEKSLHLSPDPFPAPTSPAVSPLWTPALESDCDNDTKYSHYHETPMIVDIRLRHIINPLLDPTPSASDTNPIILPLPNTTPAPLFMPFRATVRRGEEARHREQGQSERGDNTDGVGTEDTGRRLPGSIGTEDAE
ncbi:hypothetical protein PAXRUDRAFT_827265 [Paxillus rubicundulus Ve08.2h10]|uniref:DUF1746 domain-containing protein n=1 Tax=Paxillus rubicundulus Ve08.2h10 TaxID=930991 RepID=A0A0D0DD28_9AGAM|nr:hypothetical protein PAXRUDRAFT_827265 [Paxillus rubicundulus Ve08.2h10]